MKYFLNKSLIFFLLFILLVNYNLQAPTKGTKGKKTKKKIANCITRYTKWNISGWKDNELKYFDRHPVKCPKNYLLKFFKMQLDKKLTYKPSDSAELTRMRFKYTCCKVKVYSCKWYKTKFVKSEDAYKLAQLKAKCKCNKVMKEFKFATKFEQPGYKNPKTLVKYKCCSFYIKKLKTYLIKKLSTQWNDSGKGRTKFLSRHNIRCPSSSFISTFRLALQENNTKTNPSTRFNYSCVSPEFKTRKKNNKKFHLEKIQVINNQYKSHYLNKPVAFSQVKKSDKLNSINRKMGTNIPSPNVPVQRMFNPNKQFSTTKSTVPKVPGPGNITTGSKVNEINSPDFSKK